MSNLKGSVICLNLWLHGTTWSFSHIMGPSLNCAGLSELPWRSQRQRKSNQLTFMLPSRLARSMTRNFLMRSLGEGETVSESTAARCVSEKCPHTLTRKNCYGPSNTVKMTNVSSLEVKGDRGWPCASCPFDNFLIELCETSKWCRHPREGNEDDSQLLTNRERSTKLPYLTPHELLTYS